MNQQIENIIKKNLPEDRGTKNYTSSHEAIMNSDRDYGFNQALSQINTSLIADEVLKVVKQEIKKHLNSEVICTKKCLLDYLSPNKENKNNE